MIENSTTTVVPGDGLVHRGPGVVLLLPRLTVGQLPPARALIGTCATAAVDSTGRSTVLAIAGILTSGGPQLPAFGLGLDTDQGLVVLLHAEAEAEVQPAGSAPVRLSGTDSLAWVEKRFPGTVSAFRLWLPESPHQSYPGTEPTAAEGIALDLSRGTLHGSGVVLTLNEKPLMMGEVEAPAGRAAMVTPTSAHVTMQPPAPHPALPQPVSPVSPASPDRSHGSLLPPTPQYGQPLIQSPSHSPIEPRTPTANPASQVHLPIQPYLRTQAPADGEPGPNQDWAGHFPLDQCEAGPSPAAPARSELHAEPLPDEPLRTPGGGIAVLRANVPPIEGVLCVRGHFTDPQAAYCAICGISMQQVSRQITRRPRPPLGVLVLDDGTSMTVDGDLVIGRDPTSHPAVLAGDAKPMFLNDDVDGVSRVHARITLIDWTVCLTDEESANGTYLATTPAGTNGQAVRGDLPVELASGSVIRIGRRTLTFDAYHSAGE